MIAHFQDISYFDFFSPMLLKTYSQAPIFISELLRSEVLPTDLPLFIWSLLVTHLK
jgi:hypothetical protein